MAWVRKAQDSLRQSVSVVFAATAALKADPMDPGALSDYGYFLQSACRFRFPTELPPPPFFSLMAIQVLACRLCMPKDTKRPVCKPFAQRTLCTQPVLFALLPHLNLRFTLPCEQTEAPSRRDRTARRGGGEGAGRGGGYSRWAAWRGKLGRTSITVTWPARRSSTGRPWLWIQVLFPIYIAGRGRMIHRGRLCHGGQRGDVVAMKASFDEKRALVGVTILSSEPRYLCLCSCKYR